MMPRLLDAYTVVLAPDLDHRIWAGNPVAMGFLPKGWGLPLGLKPGFECGHLSGQQL